MKKYKIYPLSSGEHAFRIFCQWIKLNHSWHKHKYDDNGYYREWSVLDYRKNEIDVHLSRLACVNKWALKTLRCTYIDIYQDYLVDAWRSAIDLKYNYCWSEDNIFHKNFGQIFFRLQDWSSDKHKHKYLIQLKKEFNEKKWKYKEKILKTYGYARMVVEIEEYPDYDMIIDPLDDYYDPKLEQFL